MVQEYIKMGVDLISFSGDKLIGGPQSGIICGKKKLIKKIHSNSMYRALRCDKFTISVMESTLRTSTADNDINAIRNMGVIPPKDGYLNELRRVTTEHGIVLIFDEVMTGFRVAYGGAQEIYGVDADLTCFGKIIGGGLPVGAYGGRKEIMQCVSPIGDVYQAGTLSGNPLAMAAGIATLKELIYIA